MTKLRIAVIGAALCGLVAAAVAEAYKTSAREGRRHSRLYVEEEFGKDHGLTQRECWRIGRKGVGRAGFRVARNGVVCRFSSPTRRNAYRRVFLIAVKDNRPEGRLTVQGVAQLSGDEIVRDAEWCDGESGATAPPKPEGATKLLSGS